MHLWVYNPLVLFRMKFSLGFLLSFNPDSQTMAMCWRRGTTMDSEGQEVSISYLWLPLQGREWEKQPRENPDHLIKYTGWTQISTSSNTGLLNAEYLTPVLAWATEQQPWHQGFLKHQSFALKPLVFLMGDHMNTKNINSSRLLSQIGLVFLLVLPNYRILPTM